MATAWSEDQVNALRTACAADLTAAQIQQAYFPDRSLTSVTNKIQRLGCGPVVTARTGPAPLEQSVDIDSKIPEWLDRLRPVALPAPTKARATVAASNLTMVAGDFHFPEQCDASVSIFLETVRQLKPKRVILNGDTVDLLAVSKYPKDQRHVYALRDEVAAFHGFLHQLMDIGNAWGLRVLETEANHSGNGTASRWHRYLSDRVPVLYKHPKAQELLSYETWFYPDWCPIQLVDSVVVADDLLVLHGDLVRKHAAYSARGHAEKWQSSVMHSHTHRLGSSMKRIPPVGSRPEGVQRAYEIGCMCNLRPSYTSAPDWTNGFAIVAESADGDDYGVELVNISQGQAVVASLGQTVRAA